MVKIHKLAQRYNFSIIYSFFPQSKYNFLINVGVKNARSTTATLLELSPLQLFRIVHLIFYVRHLFIITS